MSHPLGSPYVRDQLAIRSAPANERRVRPDGDYVLYWMQSSQRLSDNWALRFATLEADRLGRPLLIHQELTPTYAHASDRIHTFIIDGARETARRADALGYHYDFTLRRRRADDGHTIDRLAARASLVVTDLFPTAGVMERTGTLAARTDCRVVMVDSVGVVPAALFPREEYAARTIRPKLTRARDLCLEPVEDRPPKRAPSAALIASLDIDRLDLANCDTAAAVAECEIDHDVRAVALPGGAAAGEKRLDAFLADGLQRYSERRREPTDDDGSSRLSPYLHFGQISPAHVARLTLASAPAAEGEAYLDEMLTWRELALNFCLRRADHGALTALPDWAHRSMRAHESDRRDTLYSLEQLERGETGEALWNAGQRELLATGVMHNAVRMLWGKSVLLWTPTYAEALARLVRLNDRYALDGRDPNSYANILWCFGKFDRPFARRPVWGSIRPMSLARAREKFDVAAYVARWGAGPAAPTPSRRRPSRPTLTRSPASAAQLDAAL